MMAVFFFIVHEKGFKFHAQPQSGAYSCYFFQSQNSLPAFFFKRRYSGYSQSQRHTILYYQKRHATNRMIYISLPIILYPSTSRLRKLTHAPNHIKFQYVVLNQRVLATGLEGPRDQMAVAGLNYILSITWRRNHFTSTTGQVINEVYYLAKKRGFKVIHLTCDVVQKSRPGRLRRVETRGPYIVSQ